MTLHDHLVIIESPYAGDIGQNVAYARLCMKDCFARGEYPFASHLLYPQIYDDANPDERRLGMEGGQAWMEVAGKVVVYLDLGLSPGMKIGIEAASKEGKVIEFRNLHPDLVPLPSPIPEPEPQPSFPIPYPEHQP
jgi:hypothetical protein